MIHRHRLNEADFQHLVLGGILKMPAGRDDVELIVADIGYARMHESIPDDPSEVPSSCFNKVRRIQG